MAFRTLVENQCCRFLQRMATNCSIRNAIKILLKLSVFESESIAFSGVWKVLGLILVLPDTNATSERSLSALKWVKNVFAYNQGLRQCIAAGFREDGYTHAKFFCNQFISKS